MKKEDPLKDSVRKLRDQGYSKKEILSAVEAVYEEEQHVKD